MELISFNQEQNKTAVNTEVKMIDNEVVITTGSLQVSNPLNLLVLFV